MRYANSKELTSVFLSFLLPFSSHSPTTLSSFARRPPNFTSLCPESVPFFAFLLHPGLGCLRCIVMNHNFKLKPSETSVTNDAELFNYALKSTCENGIGQPEEESHLSSCCFSLACFLLSDADDARQLAALALISPFLFLTRAARVES